MVCSCTNGQCSNCQCGKSKTYCTLKCHLKKDWTLTACLNDEIGFKVKGMKIKDIRTALIANELSPVGDQGELKKRLADCLRQIEVSKVKGGNDSESNASSNTGISRSQKSLFEAVIENEGDPAFILSLSGKEVSKLSGKGDLRRAYLLLSSKLHPDKNAGSKEAVQAFQVLLTAYEGLVNPSSEDEEEKPAKKRQKMERFTRSNHGCFKTKIECPQCKQEWGGPEMGLEEGSYNFFMMAIKQYICGRCFCKFGCMTAFHFCPHCKKQFEYDSDDYHRKIVCGNGKCGKEFGFWMFKVAEKREKEVRMEVKKAFEEERKSLAQRKRRAARAGKRVVPDDVSNGQRLQEQLFLIGLRDVCPRCGWELSRGEGGDEAKEHLGECKDEEAIGKYQKFVAKEKEKKLKKKNAVECEQEVMALKRWELNGRQVGQLWMLSENNINKQCKQFGLSTEGEKYEMIARLSKYLRSKERLMITDGKTKLSLEASYDTCSIQHADDEDLPENVHALDADELKDVCASYDISFNEKDAKMDLLQKFETLRGKNRDSQYLICDKKVVDIRDDDDDDEYRLESDDEN